MKTLTLFTKNTEKRVKVVEVEGVKDMYTIDPGSIIEYSGKSLTEKAEFISEPIPAKEHKKQKLKHAKETV